MTTVAIARESVILPALGILLIAAGAADGHDLAISARDADWTLLIRADLELVGGLWLVSGRFARAARIAALLGCVGLLASDLVRAAVGYPPRPFFGRAVVGSAWLIILDVLMLAALLGRRRTATDQGRTAPFTWRRAAVLPVALALAIAIDRSQVGQFPIIATARSGRTASGLDYLVYLPDGYYRSLRRWPMILTLHGRGESGLDLDRLRHQGLPRRVEARGGLPFVIVAPQSADWVWNTGALEIVLDEVQKRFRIDPDRVYLTGNSMGGNGTWELATERPERFAAIAPICGRGDSTRAGRLKAVPTWAFHGADDRIVPPEESERMVAALIAAGGDARLTLYPGAGHDAWTPTYANPSFFEWLLNHRRGSASSSSSLHPSE